MIGVVFQHFTGFGEVNPYFPYLLNGVMAALFPADYTLALCPKLILGDDAESISDGRFDGVLWCRPDFGGGTLEAIQNSRVPVVTMHAPPGIVPGVPTFCADNDGAMRGVVAHLVKLGHRRIAFVMDPVNTHTVEGIARRDALLTACLSSGIAMDTLAWDKSYAEIERYARPDAPHTALVCFSDTVAGEVLLTCERLGVEVPRDLSVIGFDSTPFCETTRPRLTSVTQPIERMAFMATNHLLALIREGEEGHPPSPVVSSIYDCGLDIRESTAPARTH